ncbi:MAG: permease-like cell division protein FtsX [Gallionellaceae bacterium]|jgi:cell division transport system permease protein|nr:permease-like cell division protein FtsX [Gallionellaceae bacterium]
MKNWLLQHFRDFSFSLRRIVLAPLSGLFNVLVIGIALSLPAGMYVLLHNMQDLTSRVTGAPQISVFLTLPATGADRDRIGGLLKQNPAVERAEFVPRDQALERLKQTTGLEEVIGGLEQNPLPDAFIVYPRQADAAALEALREEMRRWPGVEHVQLDSAWARKLEALLEFGRMAVLMLAALLGFALLAITFNTIRLQILTRRDEITVAKLIGATDSFIRRPFLYFGLLQGLLGGLIAWGVIAGGVSLLASRFAEIAQLYASDFTPHGLPVTDGVGLLLFSACLGWLGAWLSVVQHLRRIAP